MTSKRRRRVGRNWIIGVVGLYVLLSMPVMANAIARSLPTVPANDPRAWRRIDTLVVLDGDNRWGRVRQAGLVYGIAQPSEVWDIGNGWMLDPLQQAGIPYERIKHDGSTSNTREQMARVRRFVTEDHRNIGIIASRLQMPRVAALAAAVTLNAPLIVSPIDDEPPTTGVRQFVPAYIALRVSRDAIYELVALPYYRKRGWTR